jgi:hypothetical protein
MVAGEPGFPANINITIYAGTRFKFAFFKINYFIVDISINIFYKFYKKYKRGTSIHS